LRMPHVDGVEILRGLAERKIRAQVALSSGSDPALLEVATRIGKDRGLRMTEVLLKPLSSETLLARLEGMRASTAKVTEEDLRTAIERGEIKLDYQPKVDLKTLKPIGAEALARWFSPSRGKVSPTDFIPLAEATGLIDPLTKTVLRQALTQMATWRGQDIFLPVAVNVSPVNLKSLSFPEEIVSQCEAFGVDCSLVTLEVTETATHDDPTTMMDILTRIRLRDLRLSIDDFGTGHSSLMKLHRLPFSELKLDRSFIIEARTSKRALTITRSTVDLAHSLDMKVVAEGIEDADTAAIMVEIGCDVGQGYHFYMPMAPEMIPGLFGAEPARRRAIGDGAVGQSTA